MPAVDTTLPPPVAPGPLVQHDGPLLQLSGKGVLAPGSWKRRYCVLDGRRLYYYQLKEDGRDYRDKTSHYVDLQGYDICEEAKGVKSASNVLVISSSEIERSFFDTGRFYLSAETPADMNQWISQIRTAMTALREKPSPRKSTETTSSSQAAAVENCSLALFSSEHLDCITKQRAKGPSGRRLPRNVKSRLCYPEDVAVVQQQQRSESLPKLEEPVVRLGHIKNASIPCNRLIHRMMELDEEEATPVTASNGQTPDQSTFDQSWFLRRESGNQVAKEQQTTGRQGSKLTRGRQQQHQQQQQHNRSFDIGQQQKKKSRATVYAYSSSDDSLDLSYAQQDDEEETVETLCEPVQHMWTSTPSLAVHSNWLSVGSSTTPRPLTSKRRCQQQQQQQQTGSTSADDPPGLQHQFRLLLQQTAAMKTTLSGLEADFGASRRDMGWLQENLTTVQSAAGSVSDKVVKMQSQVANMERQINGAVKEAQQLQQRANEALKSASDAERDFRRLESDCRSLLNQLRQQQDPLCLTPMNFGVIQQPDTSGHHFHHQRPPPTFDFAALLTKSIGSSTAETAPRIKSSFRSDGLAKGGATKSISFGPTTTYATSPTDHHDDDDDPAATSTLRKTFLTSDFNQNSSLPLTCLD